MKDRAIQLNDSANAIENIDLKINVIREGVLITQGLVVANTLNQNEALIIMSNPGEFVFTPTLGAAIDDLLLDKDYLRMRHRIREHLTKDGMKVDRLELAENKPLQIVASYE
jgi:hypothetical protein